MKDSCGGLLDTKTLHVGLWRDFTTIGGYHSSGYFIFHHDDHEGRRPSGSSRNVLYNLHKVKLACSIYITICVFQVSLNTWALNCIEQGCMASLLNSNVHAIDWRMGHCYFFQHCESSCFAFLVPALFTSLQLETSSPQRGQI